MLIGIKIQSNAYWKSTWAFMKMLKSGMEHTYDTNFEMEINQEILAEHFNRMIPDMYAMIQWGINNDEDVVEPSLNFLAEGDNGEFSQDMPTQIKYEKLSNEEIYITTDDILIDREVLDYMSEHEVKTPNGNFKNVECGQTFFVYDTVNNSLMYY